VHDRIETQWRQGFRARLLLYCVTVIGLWLPFVLRAQSTEDGRFSEQSLYGAPHCPAAEFVCRDPSVAVDPFGHLYFATSSCVFRDEGFGRYKALAVLPPAGVTSGAVGLAADGAGNVFIADYDLGQIRKVAADGTIKVIAGGTNRDAADGRGQTANVPLSRPQGLAVDSEGDLYIAETGKGRIRKLLRDGTLTTVVNNSRGGALAVDSHGNLYIADRSRVYKWTPGGQLTAIAGKAGIIRYSGENGPASGATFDAWSLVADLEGALYIADHTNARILKITGDGKISSIAGQHSRGFSRDGGPATDAELGQPTSVAVDANGNVYFADFWDVNPSTNGFSCDSLVIRKISAQDGKITTLVGGPGTRLR